MDNSRRDFIKNLSFGSLAIGSSSEFTILSKKEAKVILFQGDSITDGNRTRDNDWNHVLGHGYQFIIASKLWYENPKSNFKFYNRGVSGNQITDLEKRWKEDALDLNPDVISILIGVNDCMSVVNNHHPQSLETFEKSYRNILKKTKEKLPDVTLVLCEPFILENGWVLNNTGVWQEEIKKRQKVTKALANEFDAIFVPFQSTFSAALKIAPIDFWIWDGVHPMPAGHELMAREWLKKVSSSIIF
jgi:lysophospholipase L1-like esterase